MKKSLVILVLSLVAAGMLLSCGMDADTSSVADSGDASRAVQNWSLWDSLRRMPSWWAPWSTTFVGPLM